MKRNILKVVFAILFLFLLIAKSMAQDASSINRQLWMMALMNWKLNEKWVFNEDVAYQHLFSEQPFSRYSSRSQLNYQLTGTVSFHGGLNLFYTFNKDNADLLEITPWLGAKLRWPYFWRVNFVHYLRIEQRNRLFLDDESDWTNVARFRYRMGTDIPINHYSVTDKTFYGIAAYEYISNETGGAEPLLFAATHRFEAGLGYSKSYRTRYEVILVLLETKNTVTDNYDFSSGILFLRWRQNFNWK